jgi:hypothetical protein
VLCDGYGGSWLSSFEFGKKSGDSYLERMAHPLMRCLLMLNVGASRTLEKDF